MGTFGRRAPVSRTPGDPPAAPFASQTLAFPTHLKSPTEHTAKKLQIPRRRILRLERRAFAFFAFLSQARGSVPVLFSAKRAPKKNSSHVYECVCVVCVYVRVLACMYVCGCVCVCVGSALRRTNDQACGRGIQPSRIKPQMQR